MSSYLISYYHITIYKRSLLYLHWYLNLYLYLNVYLHLYLNLYLDLYLHLFFIFISKYEFLYMEESENHHHFCIFIYHFPMISICICWQSPAHWRLSGPHVRDLSLCFGQNSPKPANVNVNYSPQCCEEMTRLNWITIFCISGTETESGNSGSQNENPRPLYS